MSHTKKNFHVWRSAFCNIGIGLLILLFPYLILKKIPFALCFLFILSTFSSLNALNVNKKSFLIIFQSFSVSENVKKEFSIHKSLIALTFGIAAYYVISIFFGAPIFENYSETLYFSVLMSVLTVYPLLWYFFFNDSLAGVLKVISDSKFDNSTESHLHSIILWTVIGAWVGAFPIPLDWDRPWQKWPITCCIGASLGNSVIHLIIGFSHVYNIYKDKRKTNRSV